MLPGLISSMTCLAEFAANYTTHSGQELPEDETTDALPTAEDGVSGKCETIKLQDGLGRMYKCEKPSFAFTDSTRRKNQAKCTGPR